MVTRPQFFGEDGFLYFHDGIVLGARAIVRSYAGFPHLGQRLIGFLGSLVPFSDAPRVYTTVSMAITALGVASFSLPGFEHVVRRRALRSLWCVAAVSLPLEEGVVPRPFTGLLASPSNLGWWLAVWLSLLSLVRLPRSPVRVTLLSLAGALAVWSTPLAAVNLPFWLLRVWMGVRQSRPRESAFALALVAALGLLVAGYGVLGARGAVGPIPTPFADPLAYVAFVLGVAAHRATALVVPATVSAWAGATGAATIDCVAVLIFGALVAGCAGGRWRALPLLAAVLWLDLGSWFFSVAGRQLWGYGPVAEFPARYGVLPGAMLVLAAVIVIDCLPSMAVRIVAASAVAGLLAWSWAPRFVLPPFVDEQWPYWAGMLEQKLATGSPAQLAIPMNPSYTPLVFDRIEFPSQTDVPPETILAGLGSGGSFRQEFVARCDRLTLIEMRLGKGGASTQGALRWFLIDAGGNILVEQDIPRAKLPADRSWQLFSFDPVAGSNGKTFTILLRAIDNAVESPLYVLGARNDPYPEGRAFSGATPVDGDASFRYACARP
jgi:hypothetical protein